MQQKRDLVARWTRTIEGWALGVKNQREIAAFFHLGGDESGARIWRALKAGVDRKTEQPKTKNRLTEKKFAAMCAAIMNPHAGPHAWVTEYRDAFKSRFRQRYEAAANRPDLEALPDGLRKLIERIECEFIESVANGIVLGHVRGTARQNGFGLANHD